MAFRMKILKPNKNNLKLAASYLRKGKSVVYPTDTAYGLGVDATNAAAVRRLYRIKGRSFKKPVHMIVADLGMAKKYVKFDALAARLFKKFMPGALTIVLDLSPNLSPPTTAGRRQRRGIRMLSAGTGTLGLRMPDHKLALTLVKKLGRPITTTSANVADQSTCYDPKEIVKQFAKRKYKPDLLIDAGKLPKRKTSTVARVGDGRIWIIRQGSITQKQLQISNWGGK